jgi:hypothetical protein
MRVSRLKISRRPITHNYIYRTPYDGAWCNRSVVYFIFIYYTHFANPEYLRNLGGPYSITRSAVSAKPSTGIFVFLQMSCEVFTWKPKENTLYPLLQFHWYGQKSSPELIDPTFKICNATFRQAKKKETNNYAHACFRCNYCQFFSRKNSFHYIKSGLHKNAVHWVFRPTKESKRHV